MGHRLIVGLGNPDPEHVDTRHNVGFRVVDALADRADVVFAQMGTAMVAQARFRGRKALLAKPQTYMNRSGTCVRTLVGRLRLGLPDILVIADDINLPTGKLRIRPDGGAGGHNGLQSIIDEVHDSSFPRLRLGIGSAFERGRQSEYVLSPFEETEQPTIDRMLIRAADASITFITQGIEPAMNIYNRPPKPDSPGNS